MHNDQYSHYQTGFTLIELLISMVIFAILSIMSYTGLRAVMDNTEVLNKQVDQLDELQRAFLLIERDLKQAIPRAVMTERGDLRPALLSSTLGIYDIEFTRGGRRVMGNKIQSSLIRIAYQLDTTTKTLHRLYWSNVDQVTGDKPLDAILLRQVDSIQFKYLYNKKWKTVWGESSNNTYYTIPDAIEVSLKHQAWGLIKRTLPYR